MSEPKTPMLFCFDEASTLPSGLYDDLFKNVVQSMRVPFELFSGWARDVVASVREAAERLRLRALDGDIEAIVSLEELGFYVNAVGDLERLASE